jgi:hypothetical protein
MSQDARSDPTYGSTKELDSFPTQGDNAPENSSPDEPSLVMLLCDSLAILWKDWSRDMRVNVLDEGNSRFSLRGKCPHCTENSVFVLVTNVHLDALGGSQYRLTGVMQCQGCDNYILGMVLRQSGPWNYLAHYPLGAPDDSVPQEVFDANPIIASDFAESLRCLWVKSYKASIAMCRRSVEATCKHFGAKRGTLEEKIDKLAERGIITEPLRQMAHAVRLSGNRQLHGKKKDTIDDPDDDASDDLDTCGKEEATAMIEFTKELFHHVYVMPAKLKMYGKANSQGEAAKPKEAS